MKCLWRHAGTMFVLPQCKQDAVCRRALRDKSRQLRRKAQTPPPTTHGVQVRGDGLIVDVEGGAGRRDPRGGMEALQRRGSRTGSRGVFWFFFNFPPPLLLAAISCCLLARQWLRVTLFLPAVITAAGAGVRNRTLYTHTTGQRD